MDNNHLYESLLREVCLLERSDLIDRLLHFEASLPLDFSASFLQQCDTDRLRHMLLAALWCLHRRSAAGSSATGSVKVH